MTSASGKMSKWINEFVVYMGYEASLELRATRQAI
jgi:hypothetical protein